MLIVVVTVDGQYVHCCDPLPLTVLKPQNMSPPQQRMFLRGKLLPDTTLLSSLALSDKQVVQVFLKLETTASPGVV